jgi:hypothetical protein
VPLVSLLKRHCFQHFQEDHEVFDTFLVDLLVMAKSCEFCEGCRDSLIRDRIIIGLNDNETINKLLKRPGTCFRLLLNFVSKKVVS